MTPRQLLGLAPEEVTNRLEYLHGCYFSHVTVSLPDDTSDSRIETRVLATRHTDSRRFHRLSAVFFDKKPVMFIQNAGREGDDYAKSHCINTKLFLDMDNYLFDKYAGRARSGNASDLDMDSYAELTNFYGEDVL